MARLMHWLNNPAGRALVRGLLRLNALRYRHKNNSEVTDMSDLKTIFGEMETRFNAAAAAGVDAVFQYLINDSEYWYVAVNDGSCTIAEGEHDEPTVTLAMDADTLQEVMSGETDGMQAFMSGRIRADGNIMEATKLATLFPVA